MSFSAYMFEVSSRKITHFYFDSVVIKLKGRVFPTLSLSDCVTSFPPVSNVAYKLQTSASLVTCNGIQSRNIIKSFIKDTQDLKVLTHFLSMLAIFQSVFRLI